jgi:hypothetical protein
VPELIGGSSGLGWAAVKAVLLFGVAVIGLRLGERRTLAQLSAFDSAVAVAIGAIIGRGATAPDTSFTSSATALVTCAGRVAQGFGDHPETAVIRMRRARGTVSVAFAESTLRPGLRAELGRLQVVQPRLVADEGAGWRAPDGASERCSWQAGRT